MPFAPEGHYYSPIPSLEELEKDYDRIWGNIPSSLPGINLYDDEQLDLLNKLESYYKEIPFPKHKEKLRYYFVNNFYSYGDAIFLYCMIRYLKPKRIIEIGSGFSSAAILDTNELFFDNKIECSFIEPHTDILKMLLKDSDSDVKIYDKRIQDIPLNIFQQLEPNDILFIDSTHVSKTGSDVNHNIHNILPTLNSGVYIHFHDIFYPFEYPVQWARMGISWNEQYMLRSFLQYNNDFKIILFTTYLNFKYKSMIDSCFPLVNNNPGGSLWIKKC